MENSKNLEKILKLAIESGFENARLDANAKHVLIPHDFGNGRMQYVNIAVKIDAAGECTPEKNIMVIFESTCMKFQQSETELMKLPLVIDLLEKNATIHFGRFALSRVGDDCKILVSCDQLLSNLDCEEFKSVVRYVAKLADDCEDEYKGLDLF